MRPSRRHPSRTFAAAVTLSMLAVTACSSGDSGSSGDVGGSGDIALPDSLESTGVLRNGVAYSFPPMAYIESGELTGADHDLAVALGEVLGITTETIDAGSTAAVFPGLQSNRYDMNLGSQGITAERLELFDMVSYSNLAYNFLVKAGNPEDVSADGCGATIGQSLGSAFIAIVEDLSAECEENGEDPIDLQTFQDAGAIRVAIEADRIDGTIGQVSGNAYNVKGGEFETVGEPTVFGVNGIVINKGNPELAEAIREALAVMIEDGTYAEILAKYDINAIALTGEPKVFTDAADLDDLP